MPPSATSASSGVNKFDPSAPVVPPMTRDGELRSPAAVQGEHALPLRRGKRLRTLRAGDSQQCAGRTVVELGCSAIVVKQRIADVTKRRGHWRVLREELVSPGRVCMPDCMQAVSGERNVPVNRTLFATLAAGLYIPHARSGETTPSCRHASSAFARKPAFDAATLPARRRRAPPSRTALGSRRTRAAAARSAPRRSRSQTASAYPTRSPSTSPPAAAPGKPPAPSS